MILAECMFLFHWQKKVKFSDERRLFVFWPNEVIEFLLSVGILSNGQKGYSERRLIFWPGEGFLSVGLNRSLISAEYRLFVFRPKRLKILAECMFLFDWPKEVKFLAERRLFVFWQNEVIDFG